MSDAYMSVIANPPFFDSAVGTSPSPERGLARHMPNDMLDAWVRAAATHAAPGGEVIFIHVAADAFRRCSTPSRPASARSPSCRSPRTPARPAIRILVRGIKGSRAPLRFSRPASSTTPSGRGFAPEFEAIFRGSAVLDW